MRDAPGRSGVPGAAHPPTIPNTITAAARMPNAIQPHWVLDSCFDEAAAAPTTAAPPGVTPDPVVVASVVTWTVVTVMGVVSVVVLSAVVVSVVVSAVVGSVVVASVEVVVVVSAATRPGCAEPVPASRSVDAAKRSATAVGPSHRRPLLPSFTVQPPISFGAVAVDHSHRPCHRGAVRRSRRTARDGGLDSRGSRPLLTLS